jgi:hypothetical protein
MDLPHNPVGQSNDRDHITFITAPTHAGWTVWASTSDRPF